MYLINQRKLGSSESQQTIKAEVDPDYSSKIATYVSGHPPLWFFLELLLFDVRVIEESDRKSINQ